MVNQTIKQLVKEQSIAIEAGVMVRWLREEKGLTQQELAKRVSFSRQKLSAIENGHRVQDNLGCLQEITNACGETLILSTSLENTRRPNNTEREDAILLAFSAGRIREAEQLLNDIRSWQYPLYQMYAKCKRNMAVCLSYYFKGREGQSLTMMNDLVFSLSNLKCEKEASHFKEMYYRISKKGSEALTLADAAGVQMR